MDLVARVRQALSEQVVHPTEFERCACALLQSRYPGLAAVEGGHDFGRDADIYFPFGAGIGDAGARGRFLVTTGDPVANLRNGLKRMREEGLPVDLIVVACSNEINAQKRKAMDQLCAKHKVPAPEIYAQDWFASQLVHEPAWRWNLLRIAADPGALFDRPLEVLDDDAATIPLVGREGTLAALTDQVSAGRDTLLVGVPGVGKTRLTTELDRRVVYLDGTRHDRLMDELLEARPDAVVVDDAHTRLDDIGDLRRIRHRAGLSFVIIAPTWPDRADEVATALPRASRVEVDLLERVDMNTLVTSAGVTSHRARGVVLGQADGRPGWALTLCGLLAAGEGDEVATGRAHRENVERFLRRVTESRTAMDTLACVAALKVVTAEMLYALAPLVGEPPAVMSGLMDRLARNGLVDGAGGAWRLQPALCAPLVAQWFFTPPAQRPWSTLSEAFPQLAPELVSSLLQAASISGSRAAREEAEFWIRGLPEPSEWDSGTFARVSEYAQLDARAAQYAVAAARTVLATPRRAQRQWGVLSDPAGHAAARQLIQSAQRFLLPDAVTGLLDLAVGDHRPRHSTPEHPARVLCDIASSIDPDFGTSIKPRKLLLRQVLGWLRTHREPPHWLVATEVLAGIFTPDASGNWTDPGAPNTITISSGIDAAEHLDQLVALWEEEVSAALGTAETQDSPGQCPAAALVPLLDLAFDWLHLGEGTSTGNSAPTEEQRRAGADGGTRMFTTLYPLLTISPGLSLRARRAIAALNDPDNIIQGIPLIPVDQDLDTFAGSGWWTARNPSDTAQQQHSLSVDALAMKIVDLGPQVGTARFCELTEESVLAGDTNSGILVAQQMTSLLGNPSDWYAAAAESGNLLLLRIVLGQWLQSGPATVPAAVLEESLQSPHLRASVMSAVLGRAQADASTELVIAAMTQQDVGVLEWLYDRSEPDEVLRQLLLHTAAAIAATTAVGFAEGQVHGPPLPDAWRPAWRRAVQHMRVDELPHHSRWRASQLLQHLAQNDPDLFEAWFTERLHEMTRQGYLTPLEPRGCEAHLADLPQPHRRRLTLLCAGLPRIGPSPLVHSIGADRELAEQMLGEGEVTTEQLREALWGQRNDILESLGPLLLEQGVPADHLAATVAQYETRWGHDSAWRQELIEYFTTLPSRAPALTAVAAAGRAQQETLLREALHKERAERIRGD
ncbi:hypothetical protein [Streptomyces sp. NPDC008141]|uniref:hypothetical protein n=1 Tax=Streptomyces sp. NPDC008141 TaxID=3364815 RepID=UPI0036E640FA